MPTVEEENTAQQWQQRRKRVMVDAAYLMESDCLPPSRLDLGLACHQLGSALYRQLSGIRTLEGDMSPIKCHRIGCYTAVGDC